MINGCLKRSIAFKMVNFLPKRLNYFSKKKKKKIKIILKKKNIKILKNLLY